MKNFISIIFLAGIAFFCCENARNGNQQIEKWGMFEAVFHGPSAGNPFTEVELKAIFKSQSTSREITGFYAGNGIYKIRFMPDATGQWVFETSSNRPELDGHSGNFTCIPPSPENHGPVGIFNTYHFRYADGTIYKQVGTTSYAWIHQGDSLEAKTLETLKSAPFNKLRMCIFPKDYLYNKNEPVYFPFERDSLGQNDFARFNPAFWEHLEKRLENLRDLGIEADLILFHPYDRWNFAVMPDSTDEFYLKYVLARLAAYRHVWWSVANEFDFMQNKSLDNWHRIFEILYRGDPYGHLRSIHNGFKLYDHALPWITHASVQSTEFERANAWRREWQKPVIFDECRYEGDVPQGWGNLSPQEMTAMFWKSLITGTYAGHGETYLHPAEILWWSKGGELHGQSPQRIAFFKNILAETPETGLEPIDQYAAGKSGEQYIYYFGEEAPPEWTFDLPERIFFKVEILDTWNMTRECLEKQFNGKFTLPLPGKKYIAVKFTKANLEFPIMKPDYQPHGALFYQSIRVKLQHPQPQTLRFTLDGTCPNWQSAKYTGPILITENKTLKVLSIDGERTSELLQVNFQEATLLPAIPVENPTPGLQFAWYTGRWENMPDFSALTPLKTGTVENFNFNMIEQEDYFGIVFHGYIRVPQDDVYTFSAASDDGSFVTIDGKKIVENDGVHGVVRKSGQIGLEAGYHRIEVQFFDNWYDHALQVDISGSNLLQQPIPSEMLFH